MPTEAQPATHRRLELVLIAAIFGLPLALATWMYYSGSSLTPAARSNKGALLLPIVSLTAALPLSDIHKVAPDQWLVLYANTGVCADTCRDALIRLRQSRLMLGNDMHRVRRVFLQGDTSIDTVEQYQQHPGLIVMTDKDLDVLLEGERPAKLLPGGCYLIDPLGNLVMYFPPDLNPSDMVDDIHHLLKLSHIG